MGEENSKGHILNTNSLEILKDQGDIDGLQEGARENNHSSFRTKPSLMIHRWLNSPSTRTTIFLQVSLISFPLQIKGNHVKIWFLGPRV
jgi:hypothetical protein